MNHNLAARDDVDADRIVVVGGSQGGRLAIVAAGIDGRVRAAVAAIAHFGNQPYQAWSTACNEAGDSGMGVPGPPMQSGKTATRVAYYDPMSFAPAITASVLMNAGLVDPGSRPSHVFTVYNRLGANR